MLLATRVLIPGHFLAGEHDRQRLLPARPNLLPSLPFQAASEVIGIKGPQRRAHQGQRTARIVPLLAQAQAEGPHLLFAQPRGIGPRVPSEQHRIQHVGFTGSRTQIAQLDKLPKLLYGFISNGWIFSYSPIYPNLSTTPRAVSRRGSGLVQPIAAANRSVRHAGCFRPPPPTPAASAPRSAVAELGAVRRRYALPEMNTKEANLVVDRLCLREPIPEIAEPRVISMRLCLPISPDNTTWLSR